MRSLLAFLATLAFCCGYSQELIWERSFSTPGLGGGLYQLLQARDGGVFVFTTSSHSNSQVDWNETEITRFAEDGTQMWQVRGIAGIAGHASVAEDSTGAVLILTKSQYLFSGSTMPNLIKYSAAGQLLWSREQGSTGSGNIGVNDDNSIFWCTGTRTKLYSPAGAQLWDIAGSGRITRKNASEVYVDAGTAVAVFGPSGLIRVFNAPNAALGAKLPGEIYVRGEGTVVSAYSEFGNVLWSTNLTGSYGSTHLSTDGKYVLAVSGQWIYWLDHQGNMLRQTAAPVAPHQAFLDGLGGAIFQGNTRERHTRYLGVVSIEQDPQLATASGTRSDLFTVSFNGQAVVRRYHAGVDHYLATLSRGVVTQNSHYALMHSGDGYWRIRPGVTFSTGQAPISMVLNYEAPPEAPSEMGFIIESRASASAIRQKVEAFDVQANGWVVIEGDTQLPFGENPDRYGVIGIPNPENFIDPATRRVRIRIEYRAVGPVFAFPWQASIDRTMLRYIKE